MAQMTGKQYKDSLKKLSPVIYYLGKKLIMSPPTRHSSRM